jgi:hypothetical protein
MMTTAIEDFLYRRNWAHLVLEFDLCWKRIVLKLVEQPSPEDQGNQAWATMKPDLVVEFKDATITGVDVSYCDVEDFSLPWDFIGFDCKKIAGNRWEFVMHTDGGEYCFEAQWPLIADDSDDGM